MWFLLLKIYLVTLNRSRYNSFWTFIDGHPSYMYIYIYLILVIWFDKKHSTRSDSWEWHEEEDSNGKTKTKSCMALFSPSSNRWGVLDHLYQSRRLHDREREPFVYLFVLSYVLFIKTKKILKDPSLRYNFCCDEKWKNEGSKFVPLNERVS